MVEFQLRCLESMISALHLHLLLFETSDIDTCTVLFSIEWQRDVREREDEKFHVEAAEKLQVEET